MQLDYQVVTKKNPACQVSVWAVAELGSQIAKAGGGDLLTATMRYT